MWVARAVHSPGGRKAAVKLLQVVQEEEGAQVDVVQRPDPVLGVADLAGLDALELLRAPLAAALVLLARRLD
eukprot:3296548-Alexandrium_andersonii.AAC.1